MQQNSAEADLAAVIYDGKSLKNGILLYAVQLLSNIHTNTMRMLSPDMGSEAAHKTVV